MIINNSSVAGLRGMARLSHYAASKWGLVGLTKSWAIELAPHGIRVVSIHPTGVNTPMNDGLAALEGLTPARSRERSAGNLLPVPWIEPETWPRRWSTWPRIGPGSSPGEPGPGRGAAYPRAPPSIAPTPDRMPFLGQPEAVLQDPSAAR